jgi:hypothetical protein
MVFLASRFDAGGHFNQIQSGSRKYQDSSSPAAPVRRTGPNMISIPQCSKWARTFFKEVCTRKPKSAEPEWPVGLGFKLLPAWCRVDSLGTASRSSLQNLLYSSPLQHDPGVAHEAVAGHDVVAGVVIHQSGFMSAAGLGCGHCGHRPAGAAGALIFGRGLEHPGAV